MPHLCLQMRRIPYINNHCKTKSSTYNRECSVSANPPMLLLKHQSPTDSTKYHSQSWGNLIAPFTRDPSFPPHFPPLQESIAFQENIANVINQEINKLTRLREQQLLQSHIENVHNQMLLLLKQRDWSNKQLIQALGNQPTIQYHCNLKYDKNQIFLSNNIY